MIIGTRLIQELPLLIYPVHAAPPLPSTHTSVTHRTTWTNIRDPRTFHLQPRLTLQPCLTTLLYPERPLSNGWRITCISRYSNNGKVSRAGYMDTFPLFTTPIDNDNDLRTAVKKTVATIAWMLQDQAQPSARR